MRVLSSSALDLPMQILCRVDSTQSILVDEKEETFPRGGQELLTPLEKSILKTKAKQDVLFAEVSSVAKTEQCECVS